MDGLAASMPCREREHEFLFSVIVPVYRTEEYVEETLESVINQTIGFEKNIQLILVNNATPDGAGEICKHYQERYPNNVLYIDLPENLGPSGARNAGIPYIKGKYVNFLDSDDKWALDAFSHAADFLKKHGDEVTFTTCRKHYFDAWDSWFYDDGHFHKTRVCDIFDEPKGSQFWIGAGFFNTEVLTRLKFDPDAKYCEDMKFLNEVILQDTKYGILREAVFFYRKRTSQNLSQVQLQRKESYWYFEAVDKSYLYLCDLSKKYYDRLIPYIQYVVMQEMSWRIYQEEFPGYFTDQDSCAYYRKLAQLAKHIDDFVIYSFAGMWKEYKLVCLKLKYGGDIYRQFECRHGKLVFHNLPWCSLDEPSIVTIMEEHEENDCLMIDGKINFPFPTDCYEVFAKDDLGNYYPIQEYPGDSSNIRLALGEPCLIKRCFRVAVPLEQVSKITMVIRWGSIERTLNPAFGKFSRLTRRIKHSYFVESGYLFSVDGRAVAVKPAAQSLHEQYETAICGELKQMGCKRALFLRRVFSLAKRLLNGKKVWLISDRMTRAKDNGEFMFRYLHEHPQPGVKPYFVVSKNSSDYRRMRQFGTVVAIESLKYQVLFLAADAVLSSTWGYQIEDPFGWHRDLIKDLFHYRYIYLDHALTKDDISHDVNKHMRNFAMWTTGAQKETESILNYPYGYLPDVPQTTGLARYDAIYPAIDAPPQKTILIAPTWRKSLAQSFDKNGMVQYSETFAESDFFRFYNDLMNDRRLLEVMQKKGYKGILRLHPTISAQAKDFMCNEIFSIQPQSESYENEFFENALVVTDYSSLAMDYAYVKRAVVYTQFDKTEFYQTHSYRESYFDYEQDGFGPVCYDYEDTVQAVINTLKCDCKIDPQYMKRRKAFFAHIDDKNRERICQAVLSLSGHGNMGGTDSDHI